jgi:hypothetical protein
MFRLFSANPRISFSYKVLEVPNRISYPLLRICQTLTPADPLSARVEIVYLSIFGQVAEGNPPSARRLFSRLAPSWPDGPCRARQCYTASLQVQPMVRRR